MPNYKIGWGTGLVATSPTLKTTLPEHTAVQVLHFDSNLGGAMKAMHHTKAGYTSDYLTSQEFTALTVTVLSDATAGKFELWQHDTADTAGGTKIFQAYVPALAGEYTYPINASWASGYYVNFQGNSRIHNITLVGRVDTVQ